MADVEEYFPRGGKKPTTTYFKQSANFLGAPEKREKKKKKVKKSEGDDGYLSDEGTREISESAKNCAHGINNKTIKEGVLILGRVKSIYETKLIISLPCRMLGSVMACHISEPYNKQLEAYVNDKVDKVIELSEMFRAGQYVALKVLEVDGTNIMLSMMPQHVNAQRKQSELLKGTLLQAAVSSVEDHGFVMDIGVPNTRAFLPKDNANPEVNLEVGSVIWCTVKSVSENGVVTLSGELAALQNSLQRQKTSSPILPGSTLEFVVETPLDNGIEGQVFRDTTAYIQRQHADTVKGKKPSLGQKIRAHLLYVMPIRNTPFLTMKNIFERTYPDVEKEQKLMDGDIIEDAKVLKITGRSIHFRLKHDCLGTMSLKRIHIDEELTDEEVVAKSYPIGSTHKVRVLGYNLSDYVYSITDQPDVVGERYFSLQQLKVGEVVEGTIKSVAENHVLVNVGRMSGYVSQNHLTDTGIVNDPKKSTTSKLTKKKYKVGQPVTARVLVVDPAKQTLFLTLKPSLLASDLNVLSSYENVDVGKAYIGVIKSVKPDYLLVSFFNNVTAYIPRNQVTKEPLDSITEAFHMGQIVNCTIMWVDPTAQKMTGSLTMAPFWPEKLPEKRKREPANDVQAKKQKLDKTEVKETKKKTKKSKTNDEETEINTEVEEEGTQNKKNKKKNKKQDTDIEEEGIAVKKDKKSKSETLEESTVCKKVKKSKKTEAKDVEETTTTKKDKKRKLKEEIDEPKVTKTDKKKLNKEKQTEITVDNDINIFEDSDKLLDPLEQRLSNFTDCTTEKKYKKTILSISKAINRRKAEMEKIIEEISSIEETGLNSENKKSHTAMQNQKLVLEVIISKLSEALNTGLAKLKEMGVDFDLDFKKKRKEERVAAKLNKEVKIEDVETKVIKKVDIKVVDSTEPGLEPLNPQDFWSAADSSVKNVPEDESSSSEDEEENQPKKKRKKLTVAEKLAKVREEEERVRDMERRAIESESQPRSSEQFERALLANPNSSQLWIAYMAFHLQATEVEKARAVGRKALNSISFREELEKLNVCLAIINFEHRFGTKESQQKALEEALQINEPFKVHSKLLDIYVETSKHHELSALVDLMIRKYKRDPNTYILCGAACFKLGLVDKARQVMQKAIAVLEKKEHVTVLVQFALLERSHGARERAEALFEQVLAVYPQRVDVCSSYVDMLLKSGDIDHVRQVMERMTSQKLPARKMKILYKKWIDVEEKIGDQEQVEKIRQRAMKYIEKAKF